jgi:hypothetical protein
MTRIIEYNGMEAGLENIINRIREGGKQRLNDIKIY